MKYPTALGLSRLPRPLISQIRNRFHLLPASYWGLLAAATAVCLLFSTPASAAPRQVLQGLLPPAAARAQIVGRLPAATRLNLAIGLPLRDRQGLADLLEQLYDPASFVYRQYLTPAQFTEKFGPSAQDYEALAAFAEATGLDVTYRHPNRVILDVAGSAADIERTFHLKLLVYQHPTQNRTFYAPDTQPSVDLAVPVLDVSGLDDYSLPRPKYHVRSSPGPTPMAGSGTSGSYRGNDFRAAYVPGTALTGTGQSVGLLQFDGFFANDITTYASQAGLPNVPITVVPVDGGVGSPGSGNSEVALDIEMTMSMAPGLARIYVYEAPNPSPWVDLLSRMANDNLSKQLSCSWGGGPPNAAAEQLFQQMAAQGQSFYNASGDSDAFTGSIAFPSDSPNITQVGGTTLSTTGPAGSYISETVWNWGLTAGKYLGSSGGVSTYYPIPLYQMGIDMTACQGSTTMRNIPDVALTADDVYVVYNDGSAAVFGGTSCAAPLWAAFTALVNQQAAAAGKPPVGFLNPSVYALGKGSRYNSLLHDTTTGNNFSSSSPTQYAAVNGYDLCTGWGTPQGVNLINALTLPIVVTNSSALLSESYSPPSGAIDPGESVVVSFALANAGRANSSNLVATLQPGGGVSAPGPAQSYGVLTAGGGALSKSFSFTANGSCGATITATLQLQDGAANLGTVSFPLQIGKFVTPLAQNFDSVTSPLLPSGWTTSSSGAQLPWTTSSTTADTPPNSAFSAAAPNSGVNELVSPLFTIGSTSAQLQFRNNYNLQNGPGKAGDGGVLEINIGGTGFVDILSAGGSFVSGGYGGTLDSRNNPLTGRQAWTGNSGGFIDTVVQLPPSTAGHTVQLKWRCATDGSTSSQGWYIDTVSLTEVGVFDCYLAGADLAVAQTASPASPTLGSNITYSITVTNSGPLAASSLVLTDTLPASVVFVGASPGCTYAAGQVTASFTSLSTNTATNLSITVQPTAPGLLTNRVFVTSAVVDPNSLDNTALLVSTVLTPASLAVAPAALDFGYAAVGQSVTQAWSIVNAGETLLTGVASVPPPFAIAGGSPFALSAGQTGLVAVAFSPPADSPYAANVVFSSDGGNSTNAVSGAGAYPAVPAFSAAPSTGLAPLAVTFTDASTGTITNRIFDFGDGSSTNTTLAVVQHTYSGPGTNDVLLTLHGPLGSASLTRPAYIIVTNNTPPADLALNLSVSPEPVFAGKALSYVLVVTNLGPSTANAVVVTNLLPAEAVLLSAAASQGLCTNYGQELICDLGRLSNSAAATISFTVLPSALTSVVLLTNSALITANEPDTNLSNNIAIIVSTVWLDSIGDGIPDWWRQQYFGDGNLTNSGSCATCDPDGDGFANGSEFVADTNPTNALSYLGLSGISVTPDGVRIDWHGGTGSRQFLQGRFDLSSSNEVWLDLFTNLPPTPVDNSITNPAAAPIQLFRLRATRP